jgi:sporulation integral membrane protein YtvI
MTLNLLERARTVYYDLPAELVGNIDTNLSSFFNWAQNILSISVAFLIGLLTKLPEMIVFIFIMLVSFILMSYYLPRIRELFLDLFTEKAQVKVKLILSDLHAALIGFIGAHLILSTFTYIASFIGLWIIGVKYALASALIITIVDILPILGTGSVLVPWAIYSFYHGDTRIGIGLIVLYLVITIVRRIIEPKILGDRIGLDALSTIISLYLGFKILGGIGIFLGPILFIVFKSIRKAGLLKFKFDF